MNLSARGSMNFPKSVMRPYLRAIFPSSISVSDVRMKISVGTRQTSHTRAVSFATPANHFPAYSTAAMHTGTSTMRMRERMFGTFQIFCGFGSVEGVISVIELPLSARCACQSESKMQGNMREYVLKAGARGKERGAGAPRKPTHAGRVVHASRSADCTVGLGSWSHSRLSRRRSDSRSHGRLGQPNGRSPGQSSTSTASPMRS